MLSKRPIAEGATGAAGERRGAFRYAAAMLLFALTAAVYLAGGLAFVEREFTDLRFRLFQRPPTGNLVLVAIDPQSLRELSTWPWPRAYHADVIDRLLEAGARQVALDIDFSSSSSEDMDAHLEAALVRAEGRAVLPVFRQLQRSAQGTQSVLTQPLPRFRRHVQLASINVRPERDGLVRRLSADFSDPAIRFWPMASLLAEQIDGDHASYFIDFSIDVGKVPVLSFADVLHGRFDPRLIAGKKVIIGATAAELRDNIPVPAYQTVSGVYLHLLGYESLVQHRDLRNLGPIPVLILCLVVALLFEQRFSSWSWRRSLAVAGGLSFTFPVGATVIQVIWPLLLDTAPLVLLNLLLFARGLISRIDRQTLHLFVQGLTLRRLDTLMRGVVENSFDGILTIRDNGSIDTANEAAHQILGYADGGLSGLSIAQIFPDLPRNTAESGRPLLSQRGQHETQAARHDGARVQTEIAFSDTMHGEDHVTIAIFRDITDRKTYEAQLEHQATHDSLTGLPNRTLLFDRMNQALEYAKRDAKPLALLLLDLDRFKLINDTLGHHVGDLLLTDVAERLLSPLRKTDTIARLGGDEFAVLLPAVSDAERAREVAERLLTTLERSFQVEDLQLEVGVSVGIALYPEHADAPETLLQCADVAMYTAKQDQSGLAFYDAGRDQNSVRHLAMTGELRQAIEDGQLYFHYQPKLDLKTMRPCGVEALIRWQHPTHGFIPPDEFIALAEHTGLIDQLTIWIFHKTLTQLVEWHQDGREVSMSINLSARNLHDERLADFLGGMLEDWKVQPDWLTLEITESAIMIDPEQALAVVQRFHDMGVRLSLDDFGTGHSSLGYLKRLPIDELKIDKSFVFNMTEDQDDAVIVRSTIELAHNLGLKVVAEGIESEQHVQLLRGLGCEVGQGFHFSRPLPADEVTKWFEQSELAAVHLERSNALGGFSTG